MKRLITLISLSTALAIGTTACAHQQLTKTQLSQGAATAAVIAGLVLIAATTQCSECNIDLTGPHR